MGTLLDVKFNVATRTGLQCAPKVHETLSTKAMKGTVRLSLGPFNTEAQIETVIEGLSDISQRHGRRDVQLHQQVKGQGAEWPMKL